jgi:hypothetical protein
MNQTVNWDLKAPSPNKNNHFVEKNRIILQHVKHLVKISYISFLNEET